MDSGWFTYQPPKWIEEERKKLNKLRDSHRIGETLYYKLWRKLQNHKHINFVKLGLV